MKHNNIIKLSAIAAMTALSLLSCEEHQALPDTSKGVGNIILANNAIVAPESYDRESGNAVGVIYHVSGDTAYVVCVRECGTLSFSNDDQAIDGISKSTYDYKGFENTVAILAEKDITSDAVSEIENLPNAWYLPSAGELRTLSSNLPVVERSLRIVGGEPFYDEYYLSSTEDGSTQSSSEMFVYCVNVRNGYLASTRKSEPKRVRPFMRFK